MGDGLGYDLLYGEVALRVASDMMWFMSKPMDCPQRWYGGVVCALALASYTFSLTTNEVLSQFRKLSDFQLNLTQYCTIDKQLSMKS